MDEIDKLPIERFVALLSYSHLYNNKRMNYESQSSVGPYKFEVEGK